MKVTSKKSIEQLKREKALHDEKFAGNQAHLGCAPSFDRAIENLENEESHIVFGSKSAKTETKPDSQTPTAEEPLDYTKAGDIGDEQLPAGEIKTDEKAWNYDASKNLGAEMPKKIKEFVAGL